MYGFYSEKQLEIMKRNGYNAIVYLTPDGKEVIVTEVKQINESNKWYDDCVYVGEVVKYVRQIK